MCLGPYLFLTSVVSIIKRRADVFLQPHRVRLQGRLLCTCPDKQTTLTNHLADYWHDMSHTNLTLNILKLLLPTSITPHTGVACVWCDRECDTPYKIESSPQIQRSWGEIIIVISISIIVVILIIIISRSSVVVVIAPCSFFFVKSPPHNFKLCHLFNNKSSH